MSVTKVKIDPDRLKQSIKAEGFTQPAFAKELDVHPKIVERMVSSKQRTLVTEEELARLSEPLGKYPFQLLGELLPTYDSYGWKETGTKYFVQSIMGACATLAVPHMPDHPKIEELLIRSVKNFELIKDPNINLPLSERLRLQAETRQIKRELLEDPNGPAVSAWLHPKYELVLSINSDKSQSFEWRAIPWLVIREPEAEKSLIAGNQTIKFVGDEELTEIKLNEKATELALAARPIISSRLEEETRETRGSTRTLFQDLQDDGFVENSQSILRKSTGGPENP